MSDSLEASHFGNVHGEYAAARGESAVFFLPDRTQLELTGSDRAKFLHNFCTNDIKSLPVGQGREAFVTSIQGKILGHIFVFAGETGLGIDSIPGAAARLVPHLTKYHINEDIELHDRTAELGVLYVTGPDAPERLQQALSVNVEDLQPLEQLRVDAAAPLIVRRLDLFGQPGWELLVPAANVAETWERLRTAGVHPAGSEVFESLRIEGQTPLYGVDFTEGNLAQEVARTSLAISFTKGCYLGQEPIARIDALGHVNQELRGLKLAALPVPKPGDEVLSADDRPIGHVTSAALSFADDRPVAIALLKRNFNSPGSKVKVKAGEEVVAAVIT